MPPTVYVQHCQGIGVFFSVVTVGLHSVTALFKFYPFPFRTLHFTRPYFRLSTFFQFILTYCTLSRFDSVETSLPPHRDPLSPQLNSLAR